MAGCNLFTYTHLIQHARVVDMDVTALRTVPRIRTVRGVTPSVIVPMMNFVIPLWAV